MIATRVARGITALAVMGLVLFGTVAPAGAHTAPVPESIEPPPGSELDRVPATVTLEFDSEFTREIDVRLLDPEGDAVPSSIRIAGTTVTLVVRDPDEHTPGTYRIAWSAQTTHSIDAPDGIGRESRQTHFFVGAVVSGTPAVAEPAERRRVPVLVVIAGAAAAGAAILSGRARRAGVVALLVVAAVAIAGLLGRERTGSGPRTAPLGDLGAIEVTPGEQWTVQVFDPSGRASPLATAVQLRVVDGSTTEVVDMRVDLESLGRFTAAPTSRPIAPAEVVVSTFDGPVFSIAVSG